MYFRIATVLCVLGCTVFIGTAHVVAQSSERIFIWPDAAPGEEDLAPGKALPNNPHDHPPITRIVDVRRPSMEVVLPTGQPNGTSVLILPGGGFSRVVPDLEGTEAADWLASLGVTSFVLRYRTNENLQPQEPAWRRPLQDAQRATRWIRHHHDRWSLDPDQVGLLAFSAGGQVGAVHISSAEAAYEAIDEVDDHSLRPDFAMLVYPWRCYDAKRDGLIADIKINSQTPPSFIVHTDDDASTSLGSVFLYAALKRHSVPSELHIYENGGHGYGIRDRANSNIGSWTDRATEWLQRKLPDSK